MPDPMAAVMGGPTKTQARGIVRQLTGRSYFESSGRCPHCDADIAGHSYVASSGRCPRCDRDVFQANPEVYVRGLSSRPRKVRVDGEMRTRYSTPRAVLVRPRAPGGAVYIRPYDKTGPMPAVLADEVEVTNPLPTFATIIPPMNNPCAACTAATCNPCCANASRSRGAVAANPEILDPRGEIVQSSRNLRGIREYVSRNLVKVVSISQLPSKLRWDALLQVEFENGNHYATEFASWAVLKDFVRRWRNVYGAPLVVNGRAAGVVSYDNPALAPAPGEWGPVASNPLTSRERGMILREAGQSMKLAASDERAGHGGAAEYWKGRAAGLAQAALRNPSEKREFESYAKGSRCPNCGNTKGIMDNGERKVAYLSYACPKCGEQWDAEYWWARAEENPRPRWAAQVGERYSDFPALEKKIVSRRLAEGKSVPKSVMRWYPELRHMARSNPLLQTISLVANPRKGCMNNPLMFNLDAHGKTGPAAAIMRPDDFYVSHKLRKRTPRAIAYLRTKAQPRRIIPIYNLEMAVGLACPHDREKVRRYLESWLRAWRPPDLPGFGTPEAWEEYHRATQELEPGGLGVWAAELRGQYVPKASRVRITPRAVSRAFEDNPAGAAQLAEKFAGGAVSGRAGAFYIHGNRLYSYGAHFPVAERQPDGTIVVTTRSAPSRTTAAHIGAILRATPRLMLQRADLAPEVAGPSGYSNPLTKAESRRLLGWRDVARSDERRHQARGEPIQAAYFAGLGTGYHQAEGHFRAHDPVPPVWGNPPEDNPTRRAELEAAARGVGLYVATWSPGDGVTRYRFFTRAGNSYFGPDNGIYTALGLKEAWTFVRGFAARKGLPNPLTRSEVAQVLRRTKDVARTARRAREWGQTESMKRQLSYGMGMLDTAQSFTEKGRARRAIGKMMTRYHRISPRPSSRENPFVPHEKLPPDLKKAVKAAESASFTMLSVWDIKGNVVTLDPRPADIVAAENAELEMRHYGFAVKWSDENPLTRREAQRALQMAKGSRITAEMQRSQRVASHYLGRAYGYEDSISEFGPLDMRQDATIRRSDDSMRGGALRRNPLTRREAGRLLGSARAQMQRSRHPALPASGRHYLRGVATGLTQAVGRFGPPGARRAVGRMYERTSVTATRNPPTARIPWKEGQRIPIEKARKWVQSMKDPELSRQFEQAYKLQTEANRKPRYVTWRTMPVGSPRKIDSVTAMVQYGEAPETIYRPPKGSKKGRGKLYRHKWGEGSGGSKPIPVLASADGKAIVMPLRKGQTVGDWMRG